MIPQHKWWINGDSPNTSDESMVIPQHKWWIQKSPRPIYKYLCEGIFN